MGFFSSLFGGGGLSSGRTSTVRYNGMEGVGQRHISPGRASQPDSLGGFGSGHSRATGGFGMRLNSVNASGMEGVGQRHISPGRASQPDSLGGFGSGHSRATGGFGMR